MWDARRCGKCSHGDVATVLAASTDFYVALALLWIKCVLPESAQVNREIDAEPLFGTVKATRDLELVLRGDPRCGKIIEELKERMVATFQKYGIVEMQFTLKPCMVCTNGLPILPACKVCGGRSRATKTMAHDRSGHYCGDCFAPRSTSNPLIPLAKPESPAEAEAVLLGLTFALKWPLLWWLSEVYATGIRSLASTPDPALCDWLDERGYHALSDTLDLAWVPNASVILAPIVEKFKLGLALGQVTSREEYTFGSFRTVPYKLEKTHCERCGGFDEPGFLELINHGVLVCCGPELCDNC